MSTTQSERIEEMIDAQADPMARGVSMILFRQLDILEQERARITREIVNLEERVEKLEVAKDARRP